jgi:hypothetical protein
MFLGNCTTTVKAFFLFITFDLMQSYENRDLQSFLPTNLSINPGFIKKSQKTPKAEIEKAEKIRKQYFKEKEGL